MGRRGKWAGAANGQARLLRQSITAEVQQVPGVAGQGQVGSSWRRAVLLACLSVCYTTIAVSKLSLQHNPSYSKQAHTLITIL
jgi:hypothetical protein